MQKHKQNRTVRGANWKNALRRLSIIIGVSGLYDELERCGGAEIFI